MTQPAASEDLVAVLAPLVRRVLGRTGLGEAVREDLAQETLSRVLSVRDRLGDEALAPYAVVTARHLAASSLRDDRRHRRHAHRLVDLGQPASPEEQVVAVEERQALAEALGRLSQREREALVSHVLDDASTHDLAARLRSTPGAVSALLARARARLRVEHVLSLRGVHRLPTQRCRPVLLALSAGDRRRQEALGAGRHLADCSLCADLSPPLVNRDRGLAVAWPLLPVWTAATWLGRQARRHPVPSAAAGAALAAVVVVAATLVGPPHARARPPGRLTAEGAAGISLAVVAAMAGPFHAPALTGGRLTAAHGVVLLPGGHSAGLGSYVGQPVVGRSLTVEALAGEVTPGQGLDDERFWAGVSPTQEVLVFLHIDAEPPFTIRPGQRVGFTGVLRAYHGQAQALGVASSWNGALAAQGAYVEVTSLNALVLRPGGGG